MAKAKEKLIISKEIEDLVIAKEDAASVIAQALIDDYHAFYRCIDQCIYIWEDNHYFVNDPQLENYITQYCNVFMYKVGEDLKHFQSTLRFQAEVKQKIKEMRHFEEIDLNARHLMLLQNCTIDLVSKCIKPADPEDLVINQYKFDYFGDIYEKSIINDAILEWIEVFAPTFHQFLQNAFNADKNEILRVLKILKMLFSYELCDKRIATFLTGKSRSGKTTLMRLLESITDKDFVSHISIHDFDNSFNVSELRAKIFNFGDDDKIGALCKDATATYKRILGGLFQRSPIKHKKDAVAFKVDATLVFSNNQLPFLPSDEAKSVYNRSAIIYFYREFKQDLIFEKKLISENNNIFNIILRWDDSEVEFKQFPVWWVKSEEELWNILSNPLERWCIASLRKVGGSCKVFGKQYIEYDKDGEEMVSETIDVKSLVNLANDWLMAHGYHVNSRDEYAVNEVKSFLKRHGFKTILKKSYRVCNCEVIEIDESRDIVHQIAEMPEMKAERELTSEEQIDATNDEIIADLMKQQSIIEHKMKLMEKMKNGVL